MLFISSRKSLTNENAIGPDEFWDLRLTRGVVRSRSELSGGMSDIQQAVAGKRVLLLVHGYNNEFDDVTRAYSLIEQHVNRLMTNKYDVIIGYTWPGGDDRLDYFAAKTRAGALAPRLQENIRAIHRSANRPRSLDIMTHSMGARLALESLKLLSGQGVVRNLFLMAAAVDNESIESGEEYFRANHRVRNSFVFHSRRDQVLNVAYRLAEFDRALGLHGPEDPGDVIRKSQHTLVINCKRHIGGHGDYKSEDEIYRFLSRNVDTPSADQFSTL